MPHQIAIRIIAVSVSTNIVPRLTTGGRKFKFFFFVISLLISKCGRYHVKRNANHYILLWWSFYFLKCHSTTLHPAGKKQSKQWMTSVRDVFVIFQRWLMFLFNFNFGFLGKETFKQNKFSQNSKCWFLAGIQFDDDFFQFTSNLPLNYTVLGVHSYAFILRVDISNLQCSVHESQT